MGTPEESRRLLCAAKKRFLDTLIDEILDLDKDDDLVTFIEQDKIRCLEDIFILSETDIDNTFLWFPNGDARPLKSTTKANLRVLKAWRRCFCALKSSVDKFCEKHDTFIINWSDPSVVDFIHNDMSFDQYVNGHSHPKELQFMMHSFTDRKTIDLVNSAKEWSHISYASLARLLPYYAAAYAMDHSTIQLLEHIHQSTIRSRIRAIRESHVVPSPDICNKSLGNMVQTMHNKTSHARSIQNTTLTGLALLEDSITPTNNPLLSNHVCLSSVANSSSMSSTSAMPTAFPYAPPDCPPDTMSLSTALLPTVHPLDPLTFVKTDACENPVYLHDVRHGFLKLPHHLAFGNSVVTSPDYCSSSVTNDYKCDKYRGDDHLSLGYDFVLGRFVPFETRFGHEMVNTDDINVELDPDIYPHDPHPGGNIVGLVSRA